MDDAWGKLILGRSDDCDCDFEQLVVSLNKFEWERGRETWKLSTDGDENVIHFGVGQYPLTVPRRVTAFFYEEEGSPPPIDNPSLQEREAAYFVDDRNVSLTELARELSRHIRSGSIELACVGHKKSIYVFFSRAIICSDGTATRNYIAVDHDGGSYETSECIALRDSQPLFE